MTEQKNVVKVPDIHGAVKPLGKTKAGLEEEEEGKIVGKYVAIVVN